MPRFKLTLRVLAVIIFLVSIIWLIVDPGFEPLVGFLGAIIAFLGSLSDEKREPSAENSTRQIAETRRTLLEGIYHDVVHNRLAGTLEDEIRAELKLTFQPKAVVNRTGKVDGKEQTIQEDADVVNIFERAGGKLLILGAPGAGKTTTLLRLAKMLLENAKQDEFLPIPVIFELSEWAQERKPLAEWLPQVIAFRTQSKPERWHDWFLPEKPRILALLDGLDEVPAEYRAECIQRINKFSAALTMKVVVCSRSIEYELLSETSRLVLNGAVVIEPLTEVQIGNYLITLGEKAEAIHQLLWKDKDLREMAAQPLLLNTMMLAYQEKELVILNAYLEEFQKLEREFAVQLEQKALVNTQTEQKLTELFYTEKIAIRRRHIFAHFLDTRFEMALKPETKYKKEETMKWLRWLAQQMTQRDLQAFFIEELQPKWLRDEQQKQRYHLTFGLITFLVFGLGIGLVIALTGDVVFGFMLGLQGFLINAIGKDYTADTHIKTKPNEGIILAWHHGRRVVLFYGFIFGLVFGLLGGFRFGTLGYLVFGLVGSVTFGLLNGLMSDLGKNKGMATVIQHIILRIMLTREGSAPMNYAAFLEECVRRKITVRSGNGYKFLHRLLQEHIANSD